MERTFKLLQITALIVALFAPWIYFVGYTYDWGYLESFAIERQMFFKAPQEYFGIAYVVFLNIATKLIGAISSDFFVFIFSSLAIVIVIFSAVLYWARRKKLWAKFYLCYSNWEWSKRGKITKRFVNTVAIPSYLVSASPLLILAGGAYLLLLFITPPLIGYSKGQEEAKKVKESWHPEICAAKNKMVGCTQLIEEERTVAAGKLVAISDKYVAIFDGDSILIYSLRNRAVKSTLPK